MRIRRKDVVHVEKSAGVGVKLIGRLDDLVILELKKRLRDQGISGEVTGNVATIIPNDEENLG